MAGGVVLRFVSFAIRILQFLASAVILAIYSYFLAVLANHNVSIPRWVKAVEGLSGAAALYALLGILLTCCLGGVTFFAVLAVGLDVCFVAAMMAIAIMNRHGTQSCSGTVNTPLGDGDSSSDSSTTKANLGLTCRLEKTVFAVSMIGIFLFLFSILFQVLLARNHRRQKAFGPSPANGYTYESHRPRGFLFWRRKNNAPETENLNENDLPAHPTPQDLEYQVSPEKTRFHNGFWGRNKNTTDGVNGNTYNGTYGEY
ncbi:hypothetical protein ASPZODRAFT_70158 [Penicilliopsis zonata CBS 506.65]|uniref:MARVEL domain-containing protein n=1 Tax=Penicilliopsis zonata CBS 506.65 TaxID=1073090 RepID=A0A1L9SCX1_9EURO|nr:hypothetical protein ASPZODRAFT_70158 [Penicilliopsis zonata CBS 506.65]OJJ44978.1 hypothetical protein ASPZODRAFT_70158 [Penicilliopsis zonata CBS 506.65]